MRMDRRMLLSLTAGFSGWILFAQDTRRDSGGGFAVDIRLGSDRPDPVLAILREVDAKNIQQSKERGFGGVEVVIAVTLLAKGLANLVVRLLPTWQCGVTLDARPSPILIKKNCDLPRGTILIINPDGTRKSLQQPSTQQIQSLAESFARPK